LTGATRETVKKHVMEIPEIQKWIEGKRIQQVVVVENRLVNIVV